MLERSRMTPAQRALIERQLDEDDPISVGVLPELFDPRAQYFAKLWQGLRDSTPGDQPIALQSLALEVGPDEVRRCAPLIRRMDAVLFRTQRERVEAERKRLEQKAKTRGRNR